MKRQRGRGRRSGGGNNPNKHFESNGPDVKIRGSAQQILDKYLQYARDAQTSGDRINAENYLQHAEHYYRVIAAMQPKDKPRDQQSNPSGDGKSADQKPSDGEAMSALEEGSEAGKPNKQSAEKGERVERGRRRRTKREHADASDAADPAEGSEGMQADTLGSDADAGDAVAEETPAPKPRRRASRKPKAEASDGAPEDGVMKTLARGRKPKAEVTESVDAPASETAD